MKKRKPEHHKKDKLLVAILFLLSIATLNLLENSIITNIAGTIFLISAIYGTVSMIKTNRFLFD